MTSIRQCRCLLCGRPESLHPTDPAYARAEANPGYRHICQTCSGAAGQEAQSASGLNPQLLDALDRLLEQKIR